VSEHPFEQSFSLSGGFGALLEKLIEFEIGCGESGRVLDCQSKVANGLLQLFVSDGDLAQERVSWRKRFFEFDCLFGPVPGFWQLVCFGELGRDAVPQEGRVSIVHEGHFK
jgi:hypothetical protein